MLLCETRLPVLQGLARDGDEEEEEWVLQGKLEAAGSGCGWQALGGCLPDL